MSVSNCYFCDMSAEDIEKKIEDNPDIGRYGYNGFVRGYENSMKPEFMGFVVCENCVAGIEPSKSKIKIKKDPLILKHEKFHKKYVLENPAKVVIQKTGEDLRKKGETNRKNREIAKFEAMGLIVEYRNEDLTAN